MHRLSLTDIHTHILPSIDDGASDVTEALQILKMQKSSGVDRVVLTPHFDSQKQSLEDFLVKRDFLFAALFLCRIPLEAALSIVLIATTRAAFAASASFAATAASTALMVVFTLDIALLFLKVRTLAIWARFAADLIFAKIVTSFDY